MADQLQKASLTDTATAEILSFAFNPDSLNISAQATYAKGAAIGGTGEKLHFGFTSNFSIRTELYMDRHALSDREPQHDEDVTDALMQDVMKFLLSTLFPVGRQNDPIRRAPPRLLFIWPNLVEVPVKMITESFIFQKFEHDLKPWIYRVPLVMETDLSQERITSEVIRVRGLQLAGYGR